MRKIIPEHAKKKKNKAKQLVIGIGLVAIMLFSVLGYAFRGRGNEDITGEVIYNEVGFINQNDFWTLNMGNLNFIFKHNPNEVEKINSNLKYLDNYYGKPLYIFSENEEAELEIYKNLNQVILRVQYACPEEEECDENWPVKTCEDNFIIIKENNISEITQEENCVFIKGPEENLTKLTDEFLFKILGVED